MIGKIKIYVRSCYPAGMTALRKRLIQTYFIPGWAAQTVKDFEIVVLCHVNSQQELESLDWQGLNVTFIEVASHELKDIRINEQFKQSQQVWNMLQFRVDDDDYPSAEYLEKMMHLILYGQGEPFLVSAHPTKHVLRTNKTYLSQTKWYCGKKPANNLCIFQKQPKYSVFEEHHPKMGKYFGNTGFITQEGFYMITIHKENILNHE